MVVGAAVLFASLALVVSFHGLGANSMSGPAWLLVTLGGFIFVFAQCLAAVMIVSVAMESEPTGGGGASERRITDRNSDEAKTPSRL